MPSVNPHASHRRRETHSKRIRFESKGRVSPNGIRSYRARNFSQ
jgi:hypothetical protein